MKLRGIKLDHLHTADDWNLIMTNCTIDPPQVKTYFVSVEGRDGDYDFTEALDGEVHYKNRKGKFEFLLSDGTHLDREQLLTDIYTQVHGKRLELILPDYPEYYMIGRFEVAEHTNTLAYGTVSIEAELEPWRYKLYETVRSMSVNGGETTLNLTNGGRRTVVPKFKVTGSVVVKFGASSVAMQDGEYTIPSLLVRTGGTAIKVSGTGTITATYREGVF